MSKAHTLPSNFGGSTGASTSGGIWRQTVVPDPAFTSTPYNQKRSTIAYRPDPLDDDSTSRQSVTSGQNNADNAAHNQTLPPPSALSPSSQRTSSSFRSPTMWANFEDSDDFDGESGPSHSPGGTARPTSKEMNASSDMETRNLLDNDATSEASEVPSLDEDPYCMNDEQRRYYTNYFLHLMVKTSGVADPNGALLGAHEEVIRFFKKSHLDQASLSQIWALSDVNRDGFLNCDEFCIAFHLIVIHTKGDIPLPEYLPAHVAPAPTPPRCQPPGSPDEPASPPEVDEEKIREFSTVPPPVEKPVPVKFSASSDTLDVASAAPGIIASRMLPLSPATPKGPPPKPPPRPPRPGHARSASLDLSQGKLPVVVAKQACNDVTASAISVDANRGQQLPAPVNLMASQTQRLSGGVHSPPPPVDCESLPGSARPNIVEVVPMPMPSMPITVVDAEAQTDADTADVGLSRRPTLPAMVDFEKGTTSASADSLQTAVDETAPLDWAGKCERLRKANTLKERELAKLAQIRLQLEMKIAEWRSTPVHKASNASDIG